MRDRMAAIVEAARTLIKTGSVISNVIAVRGGYKCRYITYYLRVSALPIEGSFRAEVSDDYIDYISDVNGEYVVQWRGRSKYIRFPVPYQGHVLIIPTDYGFRVYLLK